MLARGIPAKRHTPSGLIVFVRFLSYAAAPAGVKIALKPPGTFLSMLRSRGPRQNPDRSGLPSDALGVGREAAGAGCCAAVLVAVASAATRQGINTTTLESERAGTFTAVLLRRILCR